MDLSQDGDETAIYDAAQALNTFQKLYGTFPRIVGKGDYAAVSLGRVKDARYSFIYVVSDSQNS